MSERQTLSNTNKASKSIRLLRTMRRLLEMARAYRIILIFSIILIIIGGVLDGLVAPYTIALAVFSANPEDVQFQAKNADTAKTKELLDKLQLQMKDVKADKAKDLLSQLQLQTEGPKANKSKIHLDKLQEMQIYVKNHLPRHDKRSVFLFFVALMSIVYLLKCLANGLQSYTSQLFAQRVICTLRGRLFSNLMRLSSSFFEARKVGDLMSRVTSDINMLQGMVTSDLMEAIRAPIIAIAAIAVMAITNFKLTLAVMGVGPIIAYAIIISGRRMRKITREAQRRLGHLNAHLQERLASVRIVQLFTREEHEITRFEKLNESNIRANLRSAKLGAFLYPGIEFVAFVGMVVALVIAGMQIINGNLKMGGLFLFLIGAQRAGTGLIKIGKIRLALDQAMAAGERVFEVLDAENEIQEAPQPITLPKLHGEIGFREVSFRYTTGEEVLKGINITIAPGEMVALWGPSGAGKTSLANLIPRFYDPSCGHIEVDGIDIRQASLLSLRSQIGIVPQETILFAGSIHENIAYGKLEATRAEVIAAAQAANADEFICAMPGGYDAMVAERGVRLSGGQRQRIAIARAILKDPRILILDEATSSLDLKSEALVQEALSRLMVGRTAVVIAHRNSTIRNAHRILVLSEGTIIEQGRHEALLATDGVYARSLRDSTLLP
jgi:ATP-binding cassette, subfamily B, bacterial MsbA